MNGVNLAFAVKFLYQSDRNELLLLLKIMLQLEEEIYEHRPYQQAIIKMCIKRNSLVYLPTGSGKTYIAMQVIKHFPKDGSRYVNKEYNDKKY